MKLLIAIYPRAVRERYGEEISELLRESPRPLRDGLNVAWHALIERISNAMTTLTLRRAAPPLGLFTGVALALALITFGAVRFSMHQLISFNRGDLPRLDSDAMFLAQLGAMLAGLALLALAVTAGRRAGSHRFLGGRAWIAVLLCGAGFVAGYLGLFAAQGVFTADRARVAVVAPMLWAAGMSLVVGGYAAARRRGLRFAGAYAGAAAIGVHAVALGAPVIMGNTSLFRVHDALWLDADWYWTNLTTLPFYANTFGFSPLLDVRGWLMILAAGFCLGLVAAATPQPATRQAVPPPAAA